jgi:hypothetical protein
MKAIVQNVDASVELSVFDTFPRTDKMASMYAHYYFFKQNPQICTGNSIGLLLGMSVLTLCEALEWGAFRLFHWFKSSTVVLLAGQQRRIHPRPSSLIAVNL